MFRKEKKRANGTGAGQLTFKFCERRPCADEAAMTWLIPLWFDTLPKFLPPAVADAPAEAASPPPDGALPPDG